MNKVNEIGCKVMPYDCPLFLLVSQLVMQAPSIRESLHLVSQSLLSCPQKDIRRVLKRKASAVILVVSAIICRGIYGKRRTGEEEHAAPMIRA